MEKFLNKKRSQEADLIRQNREKLKKLRRLSSKVLRGNSKGGREDEVGFLIPSPRSSTLPMTTEWSWGYANVFSPSPKKSYVNSSQVREFIVIKLGRQRRRFSLHSQSLDYWILCGIVQGSDNPC